MYTLSLSHWAVSLYVFNRLTTRASKQAYPYWYGGGSLDAARLDTALLVLLSLNVRGRLICRLYDIG